MSGKSIGNFNCFASVLWLLMNRWPSRTLEIRNENENSVVRIIVRIKPSAIRFKSSIYRSAVRFEISWLKLISFCTRSILCSQ